MAEAVTGPREIRLSWPGRGIDGALTETELARLRYEAAGEPGGGEGFAIRTSVLNLVVYTVDEESAQRASEMIVALPGHHPSRAILLIARPSAGESRIDATLAAHCHVAPGLEQQVCCEEVALTVSGAAAEHLHSVVIPLLVPDLPVYVWWDAPLPEDRHIFEEMLETADRLLVDSARLDDAAVALPALVRLCGPADAVCSIGDLNWQRLEAWRHIVDRHCETPALRHLADSITRVDVGFAGKAGDRISAPAYLLLSWLARRFGWDAGNATPGRGGAARVPNGARHVTVSATPVQYAHVEPGWLVSLEMTCSLGGEKASVSISRTDDPLHLMVTVRELHGTLNESVRIEGCDAGEMLAHELDAPERDPEYREVLAGALPLIAAMRRRSKR